MMVKSKMNKIFGLNKLIILLIAILMLFAVAQTIETSSAAKSTMKSFDISKTKDFNGATMTLKASINTKTKNVVSTARYTKLVGGNSKTYFQKSGKNKLKVTNIYLTGAPGNNAIKYVKTKLTPKNYYLKVYKPSMIKSFKR